MKEFTVVCASRRHGKAMQQAQFLAEQAKKILNAEGLNKVVIEVKSVEIDKFKKLLTDIQHECEETGLSLDTMDLRYALDEILTQIIKFNSLNYPHKPSSDVS